MLSHSKIFIIFNLIAIISCYKFNLINSAGAEPQYPVLAIPDVNSQSLYEAWFDAAKEGDVALMRDLSADPLFNVNAKNSAKNTALMIAIEFDKFKVVEFLLRCPGININTQNEDGITPLMFAVKFQNIKVIQLLLKLDRTNLNTTDYSGTTALMLSCKKETRASGAKLLKIVEMLIALPEIDITITDSQEKTARTIADDSNFHDAASLIYCKEKEQDLRPRIFAAIKSDNIEKLKSAIQELQNYSKKAFQRGANLVFFNESGDTPLHLAIKKKNNKMIEIILNAQPEGLLDIKNADQQDAIELSVANPDLFAFFMSLAFAVKKETPVQEKPEDYKSKPQETRKRKLPQCAVCRKETENCCKCKTVFYCSRYCQGAHWPTHKHTCAARGKS